MSASGLSFSSVRNSENHAPVVESVELLTLPPSSSLAMYGNASASSEEDDRELLVKPVRANVVSGPIMGSSVQQYPRPPLNLAVHGLPARWQLAFLSALGFMFLYALRFNVSQALVAMTGSVTYCNGSNATAEFDWSSSAQGFIQSSFFYGYTVMSLPGGWLAGVFGSKRTIATAMILNAILCLLTPLAASLGVPYLIALRVVQGLTQAPFYPAMHRMWGKWAPQADVGSLSSVSYSGPYIGNIISYLLGGILSEHGFGAHEGQTYCGANWPSIFYVFGTGTALWVVLWLFLAFDTPAVHPRISHAERTYIEKNLASETSDPEHRVDEEPYTLLDSLPFVVCVPHRYRSNCRVPWAAILTSVPVWALCFSLLTFDYGMYTMMTSVPTYLKDVAGLDLTLSGVFSALPFALMWFITIIAGVWSGLDIVQRNLSFSKQRKLLTLIGSVVPAVCLVLAGYAKDRTLIVAYISLSAGFSGCQMVGSGINQIDLAPRYADILMGFSNTFASMGGIVAPYLAQTLTPNHKPAEWRVVFYITAALFIVGALGFVIFGSAERQWWAEGAKRASPLPPSRVCLEGDPSQSLVANMEESGNPEVQYSV